MLVVFGVHFSTLISENCSSIFESSSQFSTQTAHWDLILHLCMNHEMNLQFFLFENGEILTCQT